MKPFHVHLIAYIVINAVLLAINAAETPTEGEPVKWWAIWPLAGWGIGLATHAFADWAQNRSREGQLLADEKIRGVAVHLFVYLAVNALLVGINLTYSSDTLWFIWPLLGWGIGLAGHAWLAYRAVLRKTMEHYANEQQVLTEMQLERQAAEIAATVEEPKKTKVRSTRKRRKQTAVKTTKKRATRRGTAAKRTPRRKTVKPPGRKS